MKICYLKLYLHLQEFYCKNLRVLHAVACARATFLNFANYKYFSRCLLQIFHIFFVACKLPTIFLGIIPWKIVGK